MELLFTSVSNRSNIKIIDLSPSERSLFATPFLCINRPLYFYEIQYVPSGAFVIEPVSSESVFPAKSFTTTLW